MSNASSLVFTHESCWYERAEFIAYHSKGEYHLSTILVVSQVEDKIRIYLELEVCIKLGLPVWELD